MTHILPVVSLQQDFTTTGYYDPFLDAETGALIPIVRPVELWSLQVSGLLANNTAGTLSAWNVVLQASIDGIYSNATSILVQHASGNSNANGDVVWPTTSTISPFRALRFIRINIVSLSLGTSTKIRVSVRGE